MAGSGKRMRISLHHDLFQKRTVLFALDNRYLKHTKTYQIVALSLPDGFRFNRKFDGYVKIGSPQGQMAC